MPQNAVSTQTPFGHLSLTPATKDIAVPYDSKVIITRNYKEKWGRFQAISPFSKHDRDTPDLFDRLALLPSAALKTFNRLKRARNMKNSLCHYPTSNLTKSEGVMFNRGLKHLITQEIVKRVPVSNGQIVVKKNTYMLNPNLIMCSEWSEARILWSSL